MSYRQLIAHAAILVYLGVITIAFVYTVTGQVPRNKVLAFSYSMMAPYQGHESYNQQLAVEGLAADGTWHAIDFRSYQPFLRGEQTVRGWLVSFRNYDVDHIGRHYDDLADQLITLEAKQGRQWQQVRFFWETWPLSPGGFWHLYREPFITRIPIEQTL